MIFIAEMGSGNTCGNDKKKVADMIDAVVDVDNGVRRVVFKWQLFEEAPPNIRLKHSVFDYAFEYAKEKGYETTASVFDYSSMRKLLEYDVPFVKIACNSSFYGLAPLVHKMGLDTVVSYPSTAEMGKSLMVKPLCCVPKYPATLMQYRQNFNDTWLSFGISDHTVGWDLYDIYRPKWYERHIVLKHSKNNPDAGPFAVTPKELEGIL